MTEGERLFLQGKIDDAYKVLETEKNGRSLYLLGLIDREGYGHHRADEEKGQSRFMEGKKMGDPLCSLALFQGETGKAMWDTMNEDFAKVLRLAAGGDVLAMDEADLSYLGNGVILNFEEGLKWLAKGAFYEYWKALYDLGMAYLDGYATAPDEAKAEACFKKAAEFKDSESEYQLGLLALDRAEDKEGLDKAIDWLEKAYTHGSDEAALLLGNIYEGTATDELDVEPDPREAMEWYEKAASLGNGDAMAELSLFYQKGIVVPKDRKRAEILLKDAISNGCDDAFFSLGLLYLSEEKPAEALPYIEAAGSKGNTRALYMAGMMYLYGKGTDPDREKGMDNLKAAADAGLPEAEEELRKQGIYEI